VSITERIYLAGRTTLPQFLVANSPSLGGSTQLTAPALGRDAVQQLSPPEADADGRMQADFDRVAARAEPAGLQVVVWERFLASWPEAQATGVLPDQLRGQAQLRIAQARAGLQSSTERPPRPATPPVALNMALCAPSDKDFPEAARRAEVSGVTTVKIWVGPAGEVQSNEVHHSAGPSVPHKLLDAAALKALRRCTFRPALDATGQPIPSAVLQRVNWRLG